VTIYEFEDESFLIFPCGSFVILQAEAGNVEISLVSFSTDEISVHDDNTVDERTEQNVLSS
jgi:hypothetical protein